MTSPIDPQNPGDPEATDEQNNFSPDQAEQAAANAAEAQGVNEDDDFLTTEPDPNVTADGEADLDPTLEEDLNEALSDLDAEAAEAAPVTDPMQDLEVQLAERTEDLQRVSAEYANYRRRTAAERENTIATAKASVITKLLPILDDLDLAKQHGDLEEGALKSFADKFTDALTSQGLAAFGEEGEAFDPEIHEAVQDLSSGDEKAVGTVLRKGYRLGDKVVRTAMIIIADPQASEES